MISAVEFKAGETPVVLFMDHTGLRQIEEKHDIELAEVFNACATLSGIAALYEVALARAVARDLATEPPKNVLDEIPHQEAVKHMIRCLHLAIMGSEPPANEDESAEGKDETPVPN